MNSTAPSFSLSDVIHGLRGSVGGWAVKGWFGAVLGLLLHRRLGEILGRMERLVARFAAGQVRVVVLRPVEARPPGVRPARTEEIRPEDPTAKLPRDPTAKLPRRYGWLVRAASWQAAHYSAQLRVVLQQPEMVALLIACPQAVRMLTPLCRMLAVETSLLRPGAAAVENPAPEVKQRIHSRVRRWIGGGYPFRAGCDRRCGGIGS